MRLIRPAFLLADSAHGTVHERWSVLVDGARIAAIGPDAAFSSGQLDVLELPGALLMPGLVNAHQHGRGISQLLLGYPDDTLEPWIARRLARGAPDAGALTRLAAVEMLGNGVTCTVHANYSYGSGDYEAEARAALEAYIETGLRVTFCVGALDRGAPLYPGHDEATFVAALTPAARSLLRQPRPQPYAGDATATIALMRRLQSDFGGHPLVTLAYGPAGPQWVSDTLMAALARDANDHGLGLHLHLLESPAQAAVANRLYPDGTLAHLERLGVLGPLTALAHCVHVGPADIDVIARRGATVVHCPGSNLRLANGIAPVAELVAAGVPVALGTDNCAAADDEDLLGELRLADLIARRPPNTHRDNAAQLLARVTATGARAAFVGDRVGRIAPGWCADLTALSLARIEGAYRDPDTTLVDAVAQRARGADVVMTMVGGRLRHHDRRPVDLEVDAIRTAAAATARAHRLAPTTDAAAAATLAEALRRLCRPL
ncbi:MAG TPA: amidohydrolase family protein [Rhodocyclaceae bacterium]|nr:amidohydrolase family protein [Rhodocyclaceae bacterium]